MTIQLNAINDWRSPLYTDETHKVSGKDIIKALKAAGVSTHYARLLSDYDLIQDNGQGVWGISYYAVKETSASRTSVNNALQQVVSSLQG